MTASIFLADTDAEIESCFPVFKALRQHVKQDDFVSQVRRRQARSFRVLALRHGEVVKSAAGFRTAEFLAWGKVVYIDDLATLAGEHGQGFAASLLDGLFEYAKRHQCQGVHLHTGYTRHAAHRLYLRKGMKPSCHHMEYNRALET